MIRHPKDLCSGSIFVAVGAVAIGLATGYPMGSALKMGPAYFPTMLGALLVLIGLAVGVRSFAAPGERIADFAWKPLLHVTGATMLFGILVRGGGLVVALVGLTLLAAAASRHFSWGASAALAAGLAVFSVLVFTMALGLPISAIGPWLGG